MTGHFSRIRDAALLQEALGTLVRIIQDRDRDRASRYDLSASQWHALQALVQEGPVTVTELGDLLFLEKSTASRLAKGLLKRGLVRKRCKQGTGRRGTGEAV